jgi:hypothetical protein
MKRYGMVILMGLVLGTNVQAQTTLRTNTDIDLGRFITRRL